MLGFGDKNQSKKKNNYDQLIRKAFQYQAEGKNLEAAKYYSYLIKNGIKDHRVFSNYGTFPRKLKISRSRITT